MGAVNKNGDEHIGGQGPDKEEDNNTTERGGGMREEQSTRTEAVRVGAKKKSEVQNHPNPGAKARRMPQETKGANLGRGESSWGTDKERKTSLPGKGDQRKKEGGIKNLRRAPTLGWREGVAPKSESAGKGVCEGGGPRPLGKEHKNYSRFTRGWDMQRGESRCSHNRDA